MSFELDSQGAEQIDAMARTNGVPFGTPATDGPGFFAGSLTAPVKGLARGLVAKPALLLGDAMTPMLRGPARAADQAFGTTAFNDWLDQDQQKNRKALEYLRPDPLTTGFAGQTIGGLFDLGSSAILYTPEGAAVFEGYARRDELLSHGVDANTATAVGAVSGAATLVGVKAPVTLGQAAVGKGVTTLARNMGYGASINLATGMTERGASHDILERAGYRDQAALLDPFDRQAMLAEGVLGSLFSGGAAALQMRSTVRGQQATDAALALSTARHGAIDAAPGVPADPKSMAAHRSALDAATAQMMRNEPVNVAGAVDDTTFVLRRPEGAGAAVQEQLAHVADLLPDRPAFVIPENAPRGVRNNNPGNVQAGADRWQGQTGNDGRFATFDTPEAGVRALARNLITYQGRHGLDTVGDIIQRWAPPVHENDTPAYVRAVSTELGVTPAQRINLRDPDTLTRLSAAIIRHENGQQPYPPELLRAGVDAALGGRTAEVVTERGLRVPLRYQVRDLGELTASHDTAMQPNPAYPAELQPRDRSRDASQAQVARISQGLEPELLAESARASEGAPIIGPDGVVESGNGRMLALEQAYGGERGTAYRQWLETNAQRFGLDPQDVRSMQRPVLVRERTAPVDRAEFARQANESSLSSMSPAEQARTDAARITDLSGLVANEDGTINMAKSGAFVRQFVHAAVGPNEMGSVMQADGRLSQAGQQRLRNAVFSKAYGDSDLMAMLSESTDANVKNVLAGLMRAAPEVARLRDLTEAGARQPVDIAGPMAQAVRMFSDLRRQGVTVDQHLAQGSLLEGVIPPEVHNLLIGLSESARAPTRVAAILQRLVHQVDALGDPRQAGMFDGQAPNAGDLTANAVEHARTAADSEATGTGGQHATEGKAADPTMRAAAEAAAEMPEMRVVLEDGTELSAREVLARADAERQAAQQESTAFEAAVNCFLRN